MSQYGKPVDARDNYCSVVNEYLSNQVTNELLASYQYMAMSAFFDRTDVALKGAAAYFKNQSMEEREHAQKLIDYINNRGGSVTFNALKPPAKCEWSSLFEAFVDAVAIEKHNNKCILELHKIAGEKNDPDVSLSGFHTKS